jgi:hypothetical protein
MKNVAFILANALPFSDGPVADPPLQHLPAKGRHEAVLEVLSTLEPRDVRLVHRRLRC